MPLDGTSLTAQKLMGSNNGNFDRPPDEPEDPDDSRPEKPEKPYSFKVCARTITGTILLAVASYAAQRYSTGLAKVGLVEMVAFSGLSTWMEHAGKNRTEWKNSNAVYKILLPSIVALLPAAASICCFHKDFDRSPILSAEARETRPPGQCQPTARHQCPNL